MKTESIVKIKHIHQLLPLIPNHEDVLILFDIDKTLVVPEIKEGLEQLLIEQILQSITKELQEFNHPYQLFEKAFLELISTQDIKMKPTEPDTVSIVHDVQHKALCGGITSRFPSLAPFTERTLKSLGIQFNLSTVIEEPINLELNPVCTVSDGILFCGIVHSKGSVLQRFLEKINLQPKSILFIDDQLDDVVEIGKTLEPSNISYLGVHYQTEPTPYDNLISLLKKHVAQNANS